MTNKQIPATKRAKGTQVRRNPLNDKKCDLVNITAANLFTSKRTLE